MKGKGGLRISAILINRVRNELMDLANADADDEVKFTLLKMVAKDMVCIRFKKKGELQYQDTRVIDR